MPIFSVPFLDKMTSLLKRLHPEITAYRDRRFNGNDEDWERALKQSTTVYVGEQSSSSDDAMHLMTAMNIFT